METIGNLENILTNATTVKSMLKILDEHFTCERENEIIMDWYSITYLFKEYGDLLIKSIIDIESIENQLKSIIKRFYNERKKNNEN